MMRVYRSLHSGTPGRRASMKTTEYVWHVHREVMLSSCIYDESEIRRVGSEASRNANHEEPSWRLASLIKSEPTVCSWNDIERHHCLEMAVFVADI